MRKYGYGFIFGICVMLIIAVVFFQWMNPPEMRICEINDTPYRVLGPGASARMDPLKQHEQYAFYVQILRVEMDLEAYLKVYPNDVAFKFEKDPENWGYIFFTNIDPQAILKFLRDPCDERLVQVSHYEYKPKAIFNPKKR